MAKYKYSVMVVKVSDPNDTEFLNNVIDKMNKLSDDGFDHYDTMPGMLFFRKPMQVESDPLAKYNPIHK
jgi:hypothetical protein